MIDRRTFVFASSALAGCTFTRVPALDTSKLSEIRSSLGPNARLGVAALDTGSGRRLDHDAGSRYAMCSTFKAPLAGMILGEVDAGRLSLSDELRVGEADLVFHAPAVKANLGRGRMSIEELCAAIVIVSDNGAANILLRKIGGPAAFTALLRRVGDPVTRLDRYEPELNMNSPGDPRDTTTPAAMLGLMRELLLGQALKAESRTRLAGWMERCATGLDRLRQGFPQDWRAGDKTGTSDNGANNDIAVAWPPERHPIIVTSYIDVGGKSDRQMNEAMNRAHAAVAREVTAAFA